ncbi:MAG: N-acetylneuraminate synthase family protein [Candidatus Kuenenbacteria bacterium]
MTKIIAEICQNHLGKRELLGQSIEAAAQAGADYVKSQIIFSQDLTYRKRFEQGETEDNGVVKTIKRPYKPEFERLQTVDLKPDDYKWFIEQAQKNNIIPIATIFSRKRIKFAAQLPWPEKTVKVASYDCPSYPMLNELCDAFDHLIISTGGAFDEEIVKAAELVKNKGKKLTFLHCVISYPNTLEMCNLARMEWLSQFADSVGWSDHTLVECDGTKAAQLAISLGASMIERHFTVLAKDETKDGPISISPEQLKALVGFSKLSREEQQAIVNQQIPERQIILGQQTREMTHTEMLNRDYYRGRFASKVWKYNWE